MKLDIPFYPMSFDDKNYCGQFVLKCVFKYMLGKEYDRDYLAKISRKFDNGFTLSAGLLYAALNEGLNAKFISKSDEIISDSEVPDVGTFYGNKSLIEVNKVSRELMRKCKSKGLVVNIKPQTLEDLLKEVDNHNCVIVVIDYGKIRKVDRQMFHFILLTGYDAKQIYFHDVGPNEPTANKAISRKLFYEAWTAPGTDQDTMIFSKK